MSEIDEFLLSRIVLDLAKIQATLEKEDTISALDQVKLLQEKIDQLNLKKKDG